MKLTGQQLRIMVNREREAHERLVLLVNELESLPEPIARKKVDFNAISDVLAELVVYRTLIAENTTHTNPLVVSTVSEMASHGAA